MSLRLPDVKEKWRGVKTSKGFHNALVFLAFVAVATAFWAILALNDSVTRTFDVRLKIVNVPDTVTFITDPPESIHVTLRDKGTNILRSGVLQHTQIDINFRDYASNNQFRFTKNDMNAALRSAFGSTAQIGAVSLDSLYLQFTTEKGKRVPVIIRADLSAAPGKVIAGKPTTETSSVKVYSLSDELDTITRVYTSSIVRRDLAETTELVVNLTPIRNAKLVPSSIKVRIPVEPLVKKESFVEVKAVNVPAGISLLLFPSKVPVSYYVPMSHFNDQTDPVTISVDYADTKLSDLDRLPMTVNIVSPLAVNPQLEFESVEYTLVKE